MHQNEAGGITFVQIPYRVFTDPKLTPTEKLTIGRLLLFAGKDGRCYPSHETISHERCLSPSQARRVVTSLKRKGWLEWRRTGKSNEYVIRTSRARTVNDDGAPTHDQIVHGRANRSCMGALQKVVLKEDLKENTDLDCLPTHHQNRDAPSGGDGCDSQIKQYPLLREVLHQHFQEEGQEDIYPTDRLVVDVMTAAGGAAEQEVMNFLRYLHEDRGCKPGSRNGPRHWAWFPAVVKDHFQPTVPAVVPMSVHQLAERWGLPTPVDY
jgi:hypothetical protein